MTPVQIVTAASVLLWFALQAVPQHRKNSPAAGKSSAGRGSGGRVADEPC